MPRRINRWVRRHVGKGGGGQTRVTIPLGAGALMISPSEISLAMIASVDLITASFASGSVSSAQPLNSLNVRVVIAEALCQRLRQTSRTTDSSEPSLFLVQLMSASRRRSSLRFSGQLQQNITWTLYPGRNV